MARASFFCYGSISMMLALSSDACLIKEHKHMKIRVTFVDFWPGFKPSQNILLSALKYYRNDLNVMLVAPDSNYDICFCSIFGSQRHLMHNKIMFLGENIRPDYSTCQASLSSDYDSYGGRNQYFPLWLLEYDLFDDNPQATLSFTDYCKLTKYCDYNPRFQDRSSKVCAIFNNRDLARINILHPLIQEGLVDGFGRYFQRPFEEGYAAKLKVLSDYKFHFCTENSYWPGYVTEKIIHAKAAGCIPIYDSRNDPWGIINTQALIDLKYLDSLELKDYISEIASSSQASKRLVQEPLFTALPFSLEDISTMVMKSVAFVLANA